RHTNAARRDNKTRIEPIDAELGPSKVRCLRRCLGIEAGIPEQVGERNWSIDGPHHVDALRPLTNWPLRQKKAQRVARRPQEDGKPAWADGLNVVCAGPRRGIGSGVGRNGGICLALAATEIAESEIRFTA